MHRRLRELAAAMAAVSAVLPLSGCEFDSTAVDRSTPIPVIHAVLNPGANDYVVLVEEVLTGRVNLDDHAPFDVNDPIRTGVGIPISGAVVMISDDHGGSAIGVEGGGGTGVYHFSNGGTHSAALALVPGERYYLRVETPRGDVVTGATTIPAFVEAPVIGGVSPFNRETDTLRLQWPEVPTARRILVRIESPFGPFSLFDVESPFLVPGDLRNFWRVEVPPVFIPGFSQQLLVSAVDSNYYDYYRSGNDPFTGRGLINRLSGGIGVFGSLVPISALGIDVTATLDKPFEGTFVKIEGGSTAPPRMTIYQAGGADGVVQLSGRYLPTPGVDPLPLIGILQGNRVAIALLRTNTLADTVMTMRGTFIEREYDLRNMATLERLIYRPN